MKSIGELYEQINEKFERFWNNKIEQKIPESIKEKLYQFKDKVDILPVLLTVFVVGVFLMLNPVSEKSDNFVKSSLLYSLTVVVYNQTEPISGALVYIVLENKTLDNGTTDKKGEVVFKNLKRAEYSVFVKYGNISKNQTIYLKRDDKIEFDIFANKSEKTVMLNTPIIKVYYPDGSLVNTLDRVVIKFNDGSKRSLIDVSGAINLTDILSTLGDYYSINDIKEIDVYKDTCSVEIDDPQHTSAVTLICQKNKDTYSLHLSVFDAETKGPVEDAAVGLFFDDGSSVYKSTDSMGRVTFEVEYGKRIKSVKIVHDKYVPFEKELDGEVVDDDKVVDEDGNNVWITTVFLNSNYDRSFDLKTIKIIGSDGEPLKNKLVFVEINGTKYAYFTDDEGNLKFVPPENNNYRIIIPGDGNHKKTVVDGDNVSNDGTVVVPTNNESDNNLVCVFVKLNNKPVVGATVTIGDNEYIIKTDNDGKGCFVNDDKKQYFVSVEYEKNNEIYKGQGTIKDQNITIDLEKVSEINNLTVYLKYNDKEVFGYVSVYHNGKFIKGIECNGKCEFSLESNLEYKLKAYYPDKDIHAEKEIKLNKNSEITIDFFLYQNKKSVVFILKDTKNETLKHKTFEVTVYSNTDDYSVNLTTDENGVSSLLALPDDVMYIRVKIPSDSNHKGLEKTIYDLTNKTIVLVLEYKEPNTCVVVRLPNGTQVESEMVLNGNLYHTYRDRPYCFYLENSEYVKFSYTGSKYYYKREKWLVPGNSYNITLEKTDEIRSNVLIYTYYNSSLVNATVKINNDPNGVDHYECNNGICNISLPVGKYSIVLTYVKDKRDLILNGNIDVVKNKTKIYKFDFFTLDDKKRINIKLNILNKINVPLSLDIYENNKKILHIDRFNNDVIKRHLDVNDTKTNINIVIYGHNKKHFYVFNKTFDFDYNRLNEYNITLKEYNASSISFGFYIKYDDGSTKPVKLNGDYELKSECYHLSNHSDKQNVTVLVPVCGEYVVEATRKGDSESISFTYDEDLENYTPTEGDGNFYFNPYKYNVTLILYSLWEKDKNLKEDMKILINGKDNGGEWIKPYKLTFSLDELRDYTVEVYWKNEYGKKVIEELNSDQKYEVLEKGTKGKTQYEKIYLENVNRSVTVYPDEITIKPGNLTAVIRLNVKLNGGKLVLNNFTGFELLEVQNESCKVNDDSNGKVEIFDCNNSNGKIYLDIKVKGILVKNVSFDYYFDTPTGNSKIEKVNIKVKFNSNGWKCLGNETYICYDRGSLTAEGNKIGDNFKNNATLIGKINIKYNNTNYYLKILDVNGTVIASNNSDSVSAKVERSGKYILYVFVNGINSTIDSLNVKIVKINYGDIDLLPSDIFYILHCDLNVPRIYIINHTAFVGEVKLSEKVKGLDGSYTLKKDVENNLYYIECPKSCVIRGNIIDVVLEVNGSYYEGKANLVNKGRRENIKIKVYNDNVSYEGIDTSLFTPYEISGRCYNGKIDKSCFNGLDLVNITFRKYFTYNNKNITYEDIRCSNVNVTHLGYSSKSLFRQPYLRWTEVDDIIEDSHFDDLYEYKFNSSVFLASMVLYGKKQMDEKVPYIWSTKDVCVFLNNTMSIILSKYVLNKNNQTGENLSKIFKGFEIRCSDKYDCNVTIGKIKLITGLFGSNNLDKYFRSCLNENVKDKVVFVYDKDEGVLKPLTKYEVEIIFEYTGDKTPNLILKFKKIGNFSRSGIISQEQFLPYFDVVHWAGDESDLNKEKGTDTEVFNIKQIVNKTIDEGSSTNYFKDNLIVENVENKKLNNDKPTFAGNGVIYFVQAFMRDHNISKSDFPIVWFLNDSKDTENYCNDKKSVYDHLKCNLRNIKIKGENLWNSVVRDWNNKYKKYNGRAFIIFGFYKNDDVYYPYVFWLGNDLKAEPYDVWKVFSNLSDLLDKGKFQCNGTETVIGVGNTFFNVSCGPLDENNFYVAMVNMRSNKNNDNSGESGGNKEEENINISSVVLNGTQYNNCKYYEDTKTIKCEGISVTLTDSIINNINNNKISNNVQSCYSKNNKVIILNFNVNNCNGNVVYCNASYKDKILNIKCQFKEEHKKPQYGIDWSKINELVVVNENGKSKTYGNKKDENDKIIFVYDLGNLGMAQYEIEKNLKNYDVVCSHQFYVPVKEDTSPFSSTKYINIYNITKSNENCDKDNEYLLVVNTSEKKAYLVSLCLWKIKIYEDKSNTYYTLNEFSISDIKQNKEYLFLKGATGTKLYDCDISYKKDCLDALREDVSQKAETVIIKVDHIDLRNKVIYAHLIAFPLASHAFFHSGDIIASYNGEKLETCEDYPDITVEKSTKICIRKDIENNCYSITRYYDDEKCSVDYECAVVDSLYINGDTVNKIVNLIPCKKGETT